MVLPESGVEQIGVVLHEDLTHRVTAEQKRPKRLRKHVFRPDRIPDLAAHFFFFIAWRRHLAKLAVGDVFDLVVIVENNLAVPRDAKAPN